MATPSAIRVRPVSRLTDGSVSCATPRMWPTFSAISTSTTGRKAGRIARVADGSANGSAGKANGGSPTQGAEATLRKSTSPASTAKR
ncbi:hypothetical protein O159_08250 [Leifsonia xyli subsp. cynodontis DSM 46306]|uniref:Uncharacterized protein n=1 Tax=Leifsonia xyli subsp. cynodontis DSM 46306 TaxID=1389489 RepID=U3P6A1_LEIXC|nr:hypothetical protein O159_08250 [Leifsonia xyli subsp. cynodontis DSM 46306]